MVVGLVKSATKKTKANTRVNSRFASSPELVAMAA